MSGGVISASKTIYFTVDGRFVHGEDIIELSSKYYDPPLAISIMKGVIYPAIDFEFYKKVTSFESEITNQYISHLFAHRTIGILKELGIQQLSIVDNLITLKAKLIAASKIDSPIAFNTKLYKLLYDLGLPPILESSSQDNIRKIDPANKTLTTGSSLENDTGKNSRRPAKSSKYNGVCWNSQRNKWKANLYSNGRNHFLGSFNNEDDAAKAYNSALHFLANSTEMPPYKKESLLSKLNIIEPESSNNTLPDDSSTDIYNAINDQELLSLLLTIDEQESPPQTLAINQSFCENYGTQGPLLFTYNDDIANQDPFGMIQPSSLSTPRII